MYNLIVSGSGGWKKENSVIKVWRDRLFEYTSKELKRRFEDSSSVPLYDNLAKLPCIFMSEGTGDQEVYIGHISNVRSNGGDISVNCYLDTELMPLCNRVLYENRLKLSIDDFEFSRNHWAVKEGDIYHLLLQMEREKMRQTPTVFTLSEVEHIDDKQISVMMPFAAQFDGVYNAIKDAAKFFGLKCNRADDIWEAHEVIQDVVNLIDRSRIIICDCSGKNPNVFYEIGIAHTLGREVILITQSEADIPFDLRHLRYIHYLNNSEGLRGLAKKIGDRMETILIA